MEQSNAGGFGGGHWSNPPYKKRALSLIPTKCRPGHVCPYHLGVNSMLSKTKMGHPPIHMILVNPYGCDVSLQPRTCENPNAFSYGKFPVCYQVVTPHVRDMTSGYNVADGGSVVDVKEEGFREDIKEEGLQDNVKEEGACSLSNEFGWDEGHTATRGE